MLLVAAALTLAIVLTLTGVFGRVRLLVLSDQNASGYRRWSIVGRLSIDTDCGATKKTCDRSGQSERLCCVVHEDEPFYG